MVMNWDLIKKPSGFRIEENIPEKGYIKVSIEPLMNGFGNTVGNTLRRILLSSIEGSAIYGFYLEGFEHPLSTLSGVYEDATQICINLKSVRLNLLEKELKINIKKKGPGKIIAGDIEKEGSGITVINKDFEILNITDNITVDLTVHMKRGVKYEISDDVDVTDKPVGFIPVDALYSPINKVKYDIIEDIRVGTERNYERLILEIWHDRTLNAEHFIPYAGKIAKDVFSALINFDEEEEETVTVLETTKSKKINDDILEKDVDILDLSKRPANCLKNINIHKIKQLVSMSRDELLKMRNMGSKSLKEIEDRLKQKDLYLGMNIKK